MQHGCFSLLTLSMCSAVHVGGGGSGEKEEPLYGARNSCMLLPVSTLSLMTAAMVDQCRTLLTRYCGLDRCFRHHTGAVVACSRPLSSASNYLW